MYRFLDQARHVWVKGQGGPHTNIMTPLRGNVKMTASMHQDRKGPKYGFGYRDLYAPVTGLFRQLKLLPIVMSGLLGMLRYGRRIADPNAATTYRWCRCAGFGTVLLDKWLIGEGGYFNRDTTGEPLPDVATECLSSHGEFITSVTSTGT